MDLFYDYARLVSSIDMRVVCNANYHLETGNKKPLSHFFLQSKGCQLNNSGALILLL